MTRRASWWWVVCATCWSGACGGGASSGVGPQAGESGASFVVAGASGAVGNGEEGAPCDGDQACNEGLKCIVGGVVDDGESSDVEIRVCARSCHDATQDCLAGEVCETPSRIPAQALCLNVADALFAHCGALDTARCGNGLDCLPIFLDDQYDGGRCIQLCTLPNASQSLPACPDGYGCSNVLGNPELGACAKTVGRGEECGVSSGAVCTVSDLCVATDGPDAHCYQDCSDAATPCVDGKTCTSLRDGGGFCQ